MYLFETRSFYWQVSYFYVIRVWEIYSLFYSLEGVSGKVFSRVFIAAEDVEVVSVDLDVSTNWQFWWCDELVVLINVLVLPSLKEWSFNDTGVLLSWLKDGDGVISQVEWDDESSINIFWNLSVESSSVSEDLLVIINIFEEVNLWLLWNKVVYVT